MVRRVEKLDGTLEMFADSILQRQRAADRAIEMAKAESALCKELHNKLASAIIGKFGIDAGKQRISINYEEKLVQIEDIQNG